MRSRHIGRQGLRLLRCLYQATDEVALMSRGFTSRAGASLPCPALPAVGRRPSLLPVQRYFSALPPHTEMTMPALSPTMTQGNLVKWLVKEGQEIAPGDALAEVETDKATLTWENQDEGFVARLLVPEGAQAVAVGTPVAVLVDEEGSVAAFKDYASGSGGAEAALATASELVAAAPAAAAAGGKDASYYSSLPAHEEMTMPALSPTMTQGNLVKWLVKEGQAVAPGDALAEVETDKATLTWECMEEGVVAKLLVPEGAQGVAVGTPVAVLVEAEEAAAAFKDYVPKGAAAAAGGAAAAAAAKADAAAAPADDDEVVWDRLGPAARILLEESHLPLDSIHGTGPHHIVTKGDVLEAIAAAEKSGKLPPSAEAERPVAAAPPPPKAAAAPAPATPAAAAAAAAAPTAELGAGRARRDGSPLFTDIPNSQIRKIIAQRLLESKRSIPHLYLSADVELEGVASLREALKQQGTKVSVNDCIVKAVALALWEVPAANAFWDPARAEVGAFPSVDVAVAVATPAGLITPIVKAANTKSVVQISEEIRDLAARARANKLAPEEFQGGSFTISNLGMYGVDNFFAIINPPQACIMAVGGARSVPVLRGKALATTSQMTVTLSADQRVYDGEVSSQFLEAFKRHMASPFRLLQ